MTKARWMLGFYHSGGAGHPHHETDFPKVEFWHENKETCMAEGRRVLMELLARRDTRDWLAHGHPDPYAVSSGAVPPDRWILSLRDLRATQQPRSPLAQPSESGSKLVE